MMGVAHKLIGDNLQQFLFNFQDVFARCEIDAVGDSEDVSVNRHGGFTKSRVEYDICSLAADPR